MFNLLSIFLALPASPGEYCDGQLGSSAEWCLLKERIPCHDLSCQIQQAHAPSSACPHGATPESCATFAAPLCTATPTCVAFAVLADASKMGHRGSWIEWYNATATSDPLDSP